MALLNEDARHFDWGRFLDLAVRQNVIALVGRNLRETGLLAATAGHRRSVPTYHRQLLPLIYDANRARNERMSAELETIALALSTQPDLAARALVCKGLPLALAAYGDVGVRRMVDIDIVVSRPDVPRLVALLKSLGYVPGRLSIDRTAIEPYPSELLRVLLLSPNLPPYVRLTGDPLYPDGNVGISTAIFPRRTGFDLPIEDVVARSEWFRLGASRIRVPCAADFLLDMCAQFFRDAKSLTAITWYRDITLMKCCDLAAFASLITLRDDWELVLELARDNGLGVPVHFALQWANLLYPAVVPEYVLAGDRHVLEFDDELLHTYGEVEGRRFAWRERDLLTRLFSTDRAWETEEVPAISATFGLPDTTARAEKA